MLRRVMFYKDRVFHLVTIIGAVASVLSVGIPGLLSEGNVIWWKLAVLFISVPFTVAAIWLVFRSEHPTRVYRIDKDADIVNYLYRWIQTGGHVLICTRDMSWADEPKMMDLLKLKASSRDLTIVLPEEVDRSNVLKAQGAEVFRVWRSGTSRYPFHDCQLWPTRIPRSDRVAKWRPASYTGIFGSR